MPDGTNFDRSGAPAVDTTTPEQAHKTLLEIAEYAKRAHEGGENLDAAFDKVSADLGTVQKQLAELATARSAPAEDMTLREFVVTKGFKSDRGNVAEGVMLRGAIDESTGVYRKGLLDQTSTVSNEWANDLRKAVGDMNIVIKAKGVRGAPKSRARVSQLLDQAPASIKSSPEIQQMKAFVDSTGSGGDWIIDLGIADLIDQNPLIRSGLADAIRVHSMRAKEEIVPAMTTGLRPYKYGPNTSDNPAAFTSSSIVTADRRRTVAGMAVLAKLDRDAEEDAIIDGAGTLRREISLALRDGREDAIINGDTAGTQDAIASWNIANRWGSAGLGGASDHRRAYDGLRKYALNTTSGGLAASVDLNATQTWDGIINSFARFTGTGGNIANTGMVANKKLLFKLFMTFSEFKQAYILGTAGTANRAELMSFSGFRLFLSDFVGTDMNASGVYDGATTTKTGIVVVNFDRWEMNQRLGTVVEMDTDITRNQNLMVARLRESLWSMEAAASGAQNLDALYLYNFTS